MRDGGMRLQWRATLIAFSLACFSVSAHAQVTPDSVLDSVRNSIVSLRVHGTPRRQQPPEPPFWGTGVIVPAAQGQTRLRILTAGHVVEKDGFWTPTGNGVDRLVFPRVMATGGGTLIEPFRGVVVHDDWDIAQVLGPRNIQAARIASASMTGAERYFVISWGRADNWEGPTEEPYVKEVKVTTAGANDPPVPTGMLLLEVVSPEPARFKPSESGSPVFDTDGRVIAIVIKERISPSGGFSRQGLAVPLSAISPWLVSAEARPIEPQPVMIAALATVERANFVGSLWNRCVFLGKYSARGLSAEAPRSRADAPFGPAVLQRVVGLFPPEDPREVSDEAATATKELPRLEEFRVPSADRAVNIRSRCPEVLPKPKRTRANERVAYYGASLAVATNKFALWVSKIQRQAYLDDYFYWGVVDKVIEDAPQ